MAVFGNDTASGYPTEVFRGTRNSKERWNAEKQWDKSFFQVTGGRMATLSDRRNLPYIEACIMETLRHHSPISLNIPHAPPSDASFRKSVGVTSKSADSRS